MATLTISATYGVSEDPVNVPLDGKLDIIVPTGGCMICLHTAINGKTEYDLTANKTFDFKNFGNATIDYDVQAPGSTCPPRAKRNAHSIQIGSGMGTP